MTREVLAERQVATTPPKRWRNRWRIIGTQIHQTKTGKTWPAGEHVGDSVWPSKEIAEQKAEEKLNGVLRFPHGEEPIRKYVEWLGAVADE